MTTVERQEVSSKLRYNIYRNHLSPIWLGDNYKISTQYIREDYICYDD